MTNEERMAFVTAVFDEGFADTGYSEDDVRKIVDRWETDVSDTVMSTTVTRERHVPPADFQDDNPGVNLV